MSKVPWCAGVLVKSDIATRAVVYMEFGESLYLSQGAFRFMRPMIEDAFRYYSDLHDKAQSNQAG